MAMALPHSTLQPCSTRIRLNPLASSRYMPMVPMLAVTGKYRVRTEIFSSLRRTGDFNFVIHKLPLTRYNVTGFTVTTKELWMLESQKKGSAKRQAEYRKRHIKEGSDQRLNVILDLQAKLALERMAKLQGVSNKELLERVLLETQSQLLTNMNDEQQNRYYGNLDLYSVPRGS
jgi:hypothetical protein